MKRCRMGIDKAKLDKLRKEREGVAEEDSRSLQNPACGPRICSLPYH